MGTQPTQRGEILPETLSNRRHEMCSNICVRSPLKETAQGLWDLGRSSSPSRSRLFFSFRSHPLHWSFDEWQLSSKFLRLRYDAPSIETVDKGIVMNLWKGFCNSCRYHPCVALCQTVAAIVEVHKSIEGPPVMGSGRVNPQSDGMPDPTDPDTGLIG